MASAFRRANRPHWYANFRGLWQHGTKRTVIRVPPSRAKSEDDARGFADECERYCRLLEGVWSVEDALHAKRLGAITQAQLDAMNAGKPSDLRTAEPEILTVRDAALSHPSTQREPAERQLEYLGYVKQFTDYAGVTALAEVTIDQVMKWIETMRKQRLAFDTRRHRLIYLRRAFVMGRRHGIVDQLAGLHLDVRDQAPRPIVVWPLTRLVAAVKEATDTRIATALVLGGLLGLRPTEICRAQVGDLHGDTIAIGMREKKNDASRRTLPIPASVMPYLKRAAKGRPAGAPLIPTNARRPNGDGLTVGGLRQLLEPTLAGTERDPVDPPAIVSKDLRKSFATWAADVISAADLERYLGHTTGLRAAVTDRHYLARHQAEQLRPACRALDRAISPLMAGTRRRIARRA